MMTCDHDYISIEGENFFIGGLGETVERNVKCIHCQQQVREIWIFSCYVEEEEE